MHLARPTLLLMLALTLAAPVRAATPVGAPVDTSSARALIAQVLKAYGGRAALAKVRAYRMEGEVYSAMRHETAPTTRVFARPGRLKVRIEYSRGPEIRLLDGARGWRSEGGRALEESHGPMLDAMTLQAARADVPWVLAEHEAQARIIAPQTLDSLTLVGLEIPIADSLTLRVYVDPATHWVRLTQSLLDRGPVHTQFETLYSDFRKVDGDSSGIVYAWHEDNRASGMPTGVTTLKRVLLEPTLAQGEFSPAAAGVDAAPVAPSAAPRDSTRHGGS